MPSVVPALRRLFENNQSSQAEEAGDKEKPLLGKFDKFVTKEDKAQCNKILKNEVNNYKKEVQEEMKKFKKDDIKKMWNNWENMSERIVGVFTNGTSHATNIIYLGLPVCVRPLARCLRSCYLTVPVLMILDVIDMIPTLDVEIPGVDVASMAAEDSIYAPTYGAFTKEMVGNCPGVALMGSLKTFDFGLDLVPTSTSGFVLDKCGYTKFVNSCCMVGICFSLTWLVVTGIIAFHEDVGFFMDCVCGVIDGAPAAMDMSCGVAFFVTMVILPQFLKGKCKYITLVVLALMSFSCLAGGVADIEGIFRKSQIKHTWWPLTVMCNKRGQ